MNALNAYVREVVRAPYQVTVRRNKVTRVFEGDKMIDEKTDETVDTEWRVDLVVNEDWGQSNKAVTLSRRTEAEALKLVPGAWAYSF